MAELKSKFDEIKEQKEKAGEFKIIERAEVYPIYQSINAEMEKFYADQRKQEKRSFEFASQLVLK